MYLKMLKSFFDMEINEHILRKRINLGFRNGDRYSGIEKPKYYDSHYNNERDKFPRWNATRDYLEYNSLFHNLASVDIKDFIKSKLHDGQKAHILEFGVGKGFFAKDIKTMFGDNVLYDGVTYDRYHELDSIEEKKLIDSVHYGRAEEYEFNKKYDLIVDFFGPVFYLDPISMARLILKSVSHLNLGGIYFIGYISPRNRLRNRIFNFLLSKGYIILQDNRSVAIIRPPVPKVIRDSL